MEKELKTFMEQKNKQTKGEVSIETDNDSGDNLPNKEKPVEQTEGAVDMRSAKALATARMILNMLFVIPLVLTMIALLGYILLRILPTVLAFLKHLFVILATMK